MTGRGDPPAQDWTNRADSGIVIDQRQTFGVSSAPAEPRQRTVAPGGYAVLDRRQVETNGGRQVVAAEDPSPVVDDISGGRRGGHPHRTTTRRGPTRPSRGRRGPGRSWRARCPQPVPGPEQGPTGSADEHRPRHLELLRHRCRPTDPSADGQPHLRGRVGPSDELRQVHLGGEHRRLPLVGRGRRRPRADQPAPRPGPADRHAVGGRDVAPPQRVPLSVVRHDHRSGDPQSGRARLRRPRPPQPSTTARSFPTSTTAGTRPAWSWSGRRCRNCVGWWTG